MVTQESRSNVMNDLIYYLDRDKVISYLEDSASKYTHASLVFEVFLVNLNGNAVCLLNEIIENVPQYVCERCNIENNLNVKKFREASKTSECIGIYLAGDIMRDGGFHNTYYRSVRCDMCGKHVKSANTNGILTSEQDKMFETISDTEIANLVNDPEQSFYISQLLNTDIYRVDKTIMKKFIERFFKIHIYDKS